MERDPLADADDYETDEEAREQPTWVEPNLNPDWGPTGKQTDDAPTSGDKLVPDPHDDHEHGDGDDKDATLKRQTKQNATKW